MNQRRGQVLAILSLVAALGLPVLLLAMAVTVAGTSAEYIRAGDEGTKATFRFCPTCGATVYYTLEGMAKQRSARRCGSGALEMTANNAARLLGPWLALLPAVAHASFNLGQASVGHNQSYPLIGFAVPYLVPAGLSVLYVRSSPRITHPGNSEE